MLKINKIHVTLIILILSSMLFTKGTSNKPNFFTQIEVFEIQEAFPNLSFSSPVDLQAPNDSSNRIFIVEQSGRIQYFDNDKTTTTKNLFLDIQDIIDYGGERGLLGLAFHPNYKNNGYLFVHYSNLNGDTVIARYTVNNADPHLVNRNSELIILQIAQPYGNHNGGQISFGPDGYLYVALGDGGSGGDPLKNGQNRSTLLGAILRIDIDNPENGNNYGIPADNPFANNAVGYKEEIFAFGLRNPWRFSFDDKDGTLVAGDVGQNKIEEVDIIESGKNYGWNMYEGSSCYIGNCDPNGKEFPIVEYDHSVGYSITGGYVYRGNKVGGLAGSYVYGDYGTGRIWKIDDYSSINRKNIEIIDTSYKITSFGVDNQNNLFFLATNGKIYEFKSMPFTQTKSDTLTSASETSSSTAKDTSISTTYSKSSSSLISKENSTGFSSKNEISTASNLNFPNISFLNVITIPILWNKRKNS